jgi:hypothetical protein
MILGHAGMIQCMVGSGDGTETDCVNGVTQCIKDIVGKYSNIKGSLI